MRRCGFDVSLERWSRAGVLLRGLLRVLLWSRGLPSFGAVFLRSRSGTRHDKLCLVPERDPRETATKLGGPRLQSRARGGPCSKAPTRGHRSRDTSKPHLRNPMTSGTRLGFIFRSSMIIVLYSSKQESRAHQQQAVVTVVLYCIGTSHTICTAFVLYTNVYSRSVILVRVDGTRRDHPSCNISSHRRAQGVRAAAGRTTQQWTSPPKTAGAVHVDVERASTTSTYTY